MATDVPPQDTMLDFSKVSLSAAEGMVLQAGLVELSRAKPSNPLRWLGQWLKENNPNFADQDMGAETNLAVQSTS